MSADPNDPRLAEYHRQRAIVAQHLAWLDTQIAQGTALPQTETPNQGPDIPNRPRQSAISHQQSFSPSASAIAPSPESILAQAPAGIPANEKWGCIAIVLVLGLLILAALFGLPYLLHYH